jgi:TonB-linked SusC/RagA family outer membrane protein
MKFVFRGSMSLMLAIICLEASAQDRRISGKVTRDADKKPMPGVTVIVKGLSAGTSTNEAGEYSLPAPPNATLVFSYVGFLSKEIKAGDKTVIDVSLSQGDSSLNEVVVIGYGTQRKKDLTGAVASVKADELIMSSSPDIGRMLQGKAAGLMIQQNSAQPGGGLDILIRGAGSVMASNAPLIVVDGFPITELQQPQNGGRYKAGTQSILNSFNPNDIESIDVLKDASATSIYGSRAANGVILITTKRGTTGTPVVQYAGNFSLQKYNNSFDVLPLNEWMQVRNEAAWEEWNYKNKVFPYGSRTPEEAKANPVAGDYRPFYTQNAINNVGRGTDWLALITRDGQIQQNNISITGGNKTTKYLLSGNYFDHKGIIKNSRLTRYTLRANIDQQFNNMFKLGLSLTASRIDNKNTQLGGEAYENSGIIRAAIQQGPHILARDENGNYPLNPQLGTQPNPYSLLTITDNGRIERMLANTWLEVTPFKGMVLRLKAGIDRGLTKRWNYLPRTTLHGALENGKASIADVDLNDYLLEATLNYTKVVADDHQFNALAGVSQQKTKTAYNENGNTGFITDAFLWNNLNAGSGTRTVSSSRLENVIASYFGRLNYNYKDRYLLTFTVRTDGASVFARNHKWATFPSVAVGWNIHEEHFFKGLDNTISQLKLRLSYGQTGNASIGSNASGAYIAYPAWVSPNDGINIGISLARLGNPDLKWETTTSYNMGLDFSLLNGLVSGSLEVYDKVISDLLAVKKLNSYNEVNTVIANIGETQSRGFEVTLNMRLLQKKDFEWRTILTASRFKDTWKKRAADWKPAIYENENDPIRARYARLHDGIMQVGDKADHMPSLIPGWIRLQDIDGFQRDASGNPVVDANGRFIRTNAPDGRLDDADTRMLGTTDPGLIGGLTNIITYKQFTLNFNFNAMFGRKMEDPNYVIYGVSADGIYQYGYNGLRTVKNRWTPERPSTTQPNSFYGYSPYGSGDFFLQDAWFIRLQNVSLAYDLPRKWLGKALQNLQLHVDAQNLFVITPYKGVDPETDSYTAAYPYVRTFTIGANIKF